MTGVWQSMLARLKETPSYKGMFAIMEGYGSDTASELTDKEGNLVSRTYAEYAEMAGVACGNLQRTRKIRTGDIVGLICDTCMDWPVYFWSLLMAGAEPLLLSPGVDPKQIQAILKEAGAKHYVADRPLQQNDHAFIDTALLLKEGRKGREVWGKNILLCTSGTTGTSRIFKFNETNIVSQILSWRNAYKKNPDLPFVEGTPVKQLAFLPFNHIFGFSVVYLLYSLTGKTIVYLRDRSVRTVFEACRRHGVTHLFCVPMFFNALASGIRRSVASLEGLPEEGKKQVQANLLGTQIRILISGGGHIPYLTLKTINDVGYPLINGFGMTECGVISFELSLDPKQRIKGSIGKPFPAVKYKLEPEGEGELFLKGNVIYDASMVKGKPVPRNKDEWFPTGDIVKEDETGLYMVGRTKEVIINASGENIYPDLIEEQLQNLPGVKQFCVLGIKNGEYEEVCLLVEKDDTTETAFDQEALEKAVAEVNGRLSSNDKIRRLLIAGEVLPTSTAMKIKRTALKKGLEEGTFPYTEAKIPDSTGTVFAEEIKEAETHIADTLSDIKKEVRHTIAEMLSVEEEKISDDTHFINDLSGDSLTVFSAINALEEHYGLVFSDDEIEGMTSVETAARVIFAKLNGLQNTRLKERPVKLKSHRITDFRNSAEYIEIQKRKEALFSDIENPYFLPHDSLIGDTSVIRGERVINLGSYNYLGMSGNPETEAAAIDAIKKYGTSASGSRTLAGEKTLYQQLEKTIADWKHTEDCIVCTGGWATNLSFISCFMKEGDFILYDALSHNSISEGVALSKAESKAFPHNDLRTLESLLIKIKGKYNKVLIVIEGVYSMDGDIAPVPEFVRLKKQYGCFLMVDEAHSGGVIGDHGGGVDDYFSLDPKDIDIKYGTLSKALGTCGGYIAADQSIIEYLRYSMNGFVFSAGISPPLAAACMKAVELIQQDNTMVKQLHRNIEYFVRRCREEGMNTCLAGESAIVPVMVGSDRDAAYLSQEMIRRGVFVPPAMYPAVPRGQSRLRFTISATHSIEQLEKAVTVLSELMKEEGFL